MQKQLIVLVRYFRHSGEHICYDASSSETCVDAATPCSAGCDPETELTCSVPGDELYGSTAYEWCVLIAMGEECPIFCDMGEQYCYGTCIAHDEFCPAQCDSDSEKVCTQPAQHAHPLQPPSHPEHSCI